MSHTSCMHCLFNSPYYVRVNRHIIFMKIRLFGVATLFASALILLVTATSAAAATLTVGGPSATYTTIQAAIDAAASGDTISVAAGTYDAFSINGKTNLTITGAGAGSTIIKPTTLINTGVGHKYTTDMQASVFVNNSTGITIQGMSVGDNGNTPGSGGPDALIFWNASSGSINSTAVTGTYTINGVQTGQGIAVDAGSGQITNLTVNNTAISGFQKNGIDAVDGNSMSSAPGTITLTIKSGSITGAGSTGVIAQNGVLLWNQGGGSVTGSINGTSISNLHYTGVNNQDVGVYTYGTNATFTSVSNVGFTNTDLYLANNGNAAIDATTGNTFDGITPASASGTQIATIENKMDDLMNDSSAAPVYIFPKTLIVTNSADNRGVQVGLNSVVVGGTVLVTPGTYAGDLMIPASNGLTLKGIGSPIISLGSGYGINLDNNVSVKNFTFEGFTVNAMNAVQPTGTSYAFKAYKADGLTLTNDTFNGGAGNTGGGVDINTTSNSTLNGVTVQGFNKNGFSFTSAYLNTDDSSLSSNITLNNITSKNNGWAGVAFYTVGNDHSPTSIGGSGSINNVQFTGTNSISNNGAGGPTQGGVFIEGDSDANVGLGHTPQNTVTTNGATLDLTHVAFSGNAPFDIINYQTAPVNAIGATFDPGAITGDAMTSAQRTTEDGKIYDKLDNSVLGLVTYYHVYVTVTIDKFIDDKAASATVATASFPMAASWTTTNIGSGSGTYALSTTGFNSPNAYEAITSPMTSGANYATNEVTSGSVVGADCSGGQSFELAGYTSGNTFTAAEAATHSLTSPTFTNLADNTYVIVWNKLCVPKPTITTPTNGIVITGTNLTEVDWTSVTDMAGGITYTYQASNSPATNTDGSFAATVYSQDGISSLSIPASGTPDGTYYIQVQAKDADGNVSAWSPTVEVIVNSSPSVTTNAATGVTGTNSTLNGTDGGINADNTSFWWGTSNAGPFTASATPGSELPSGWSHDSGLGLATADASFKESFTTLTPGTTYYFVAWIESNGTWYPGTVESFSTTGSAPTASVTTIAASSVVAAAATLNGENGAIASTNTSFWWGTSSATSFTSATDPTSELPSGWSHDSGLGAAAISSTFDEPLTGLAPSTEYYFTAWSQVGGTWYPGAVLNFTTPAPAPATPSVTTDSATPIDSTDETVNGTNGPVAADDTSFWLGTTPATSFTSIADPTGELPNGWAGVDSHAQSANTPFNYAYTGLTPNTPYYFVAWSHTGGMWYPGSVLSFTTSATNPSAPQITGEGLTVNSGTSVTITWTTDHSATSRVVYGTSPQATLSSNSCLSIPGNVSYQCYGYQYSTDEADTPVDPSGQTSHSVTINGLTAGTTYYFRPVSHGSPEAVGGVELNNAPTTPPEVSAPVAADQSKTTGENRSLAITLTATGAGSIAYATSTNPAHGTLSGTGANLTYTPTAGYIGTDSFTFKSNNGSDSNIATVSINVQSPPVLALHGNSPARLAVGSDGYSDLGAYIVSPEADSELGIVTLVDGGATTTPPVIGLTTPGTHTILYVATDGFGNEGTTSRTVIVSGPPVITLTGDATINLKVGDTYTKQGATATDFADGTDVVTPSGTVNTSTAGTYTITYNATDSVGNSATPVTRTVIVSAVPVVTPKLTSSVGNGAPVGVFGAIAGGPIGQVLGASTSTVPDTSKISCSAPLLTKYMRIGRPNDPAQVKLLQTFLNGEMGVSIPVSGFFGASTAQAVKAFQLKYASTILTPWGLSQPTGYVYKTTEWKINEINCSDLNTPFPTIN